MDNELLHLQGLSSSSSDAPSVVLILNAKDFLWVLTISRRCVCRYYFKKASDEFECGAVFEEVSDDSSLLPTYEGKILGKVERME